MLIRTPKLDGPELKALDLIWQLQKSMSPMLNEPHAWTGSLRRQSLAAAVQSSNSIEGYVESISNVHEILLNQNNPSVSRDNLAAIAGYRDAMTFVLQAIKDDATLINESLIKALHFMLTKDDLQNRPGRYRIGSVYVHNEQNNEIVHEGAPAGDVGKLMQELIEELQQSRDYDALVTAAMAHLNLVMIHPFKDGNGRMARVLQSFILGLAGTTSPIFMSIEEYLGQNTGRYYSVLADVGKGVWNSKREARPWLRFILNAHYSQALRVQQNYRFAESSWAEVSRLVNQFKIDERVISSLVHVLNGNALKNSTYIAISKDNGDVVSELTASRDLAKLVELDLLKAIGEARGRSYVGGRKLAEISEKLKGEAGVRRPIDLFA